MGSFCARYHCWVFLTWKDTKFPVLTLPQVVAMRASPNNLGSTVLNLL